MAVALILTMVCTGGANAASKKPTSKPKPVVKTHSLTIEISDEDFKYQRWLTMSGSKIVGEFFGCGNKNEYSSLGPTTRVTISNEKSKIINTGKMNWDKDLQDAEICTLTVTLKKVPKSVFYSIKVDNTTLVYSYDELVSSDWTLRLSK
jgi:hypothetical protein